MQGKPPTGHDVARLARVSQPTVSRALRGDRRVAEPTRRRVARAAAELGYVPSERGRSLATRRTGRVAVVVDELGNPFYLELLDALQRTLEAAGAQMVVFAAARSEEAAFERLVDGSVDGAVLTTILAGSTLPARLRSRGLPFVLLNRVVDDPAADSCSVDNEAGGRRIGEEIAAHGHRLPAAILGPERASTARDREAGFRAALAAHGLELPPERVARGPFTFEAGSDGMTRLLAADPRPTVVFCGNDVIALGALDAARTAGVAVPDELSVVGFDDIGMAAWHAFRLTTVRQDLRRMADVAVELLHARVEDPLVAPRQVVLPVELVRRATLAAPPGYSTKQ